MKKSKIHRVIPTKTVEVNNRTVKPISSSTVKQSLKKLGELRDEEKSYNTTEFYLRDVVFETEIKKHKRYKTETKRVEVDVYTDSTNHKLVRISELYYNYSTYEYLPQKSISIPIKDFKKMVKELKDTL